MRYEVLEQSYVNDRLVEPGEIVDIPVDVLDPANVGGNLKPVKPAKEAKDG